MNKFPSPQNDKRACKCKNGKYSRSCCDGSFQAQGIGSFVNGGSSTITTEDGSTGTTVTVNGLTELNCGGIILTGFAVSDTGAITLPTTNKGTITSTSPASFNAVTQETPRDLSVTITVPSGYTNTGSSVVCTTSTQQQAPILPTLGCSDITISGFAVSYDSVITLPTIDIGTISATSPTTFDDPDVDTLRTLNVDITVPSGYANEGATLTCTTTTIQLANQPTLSCSDITFSGLSIGVGGVVATPTTDIGTITSVSPSDYGSHVTTDTDRTYTVNVTVPSGYSNSGATLACSKTTTQVGVNEFFMEDAVSMPGNRAEQVLVLTNSSAACGRQSSIAQGHLTLVHNGANAIPTVDDTIWIDVYSAYREVRRTDSNGTFHEGYRLQFSNISGSTQYYSPAKFSVPSGAATSADFYVKNGETTGITAIGTCS